MFCDCLGNYLRLSEVSSSKLHVMSCAYASKSLTSEGRLGDESLYGLGDFQFHFNANYYVFKIYHFTGRMFGLHSSMLIGALHSTLFFDACIYQIFVECTEFSPPS